jgi:hypothetical protein
VFGLVVQFAAGAATVPRIREVRIRVGGARNIGKETTVNLAIVAGSSHPERAAQCGGRMTGA